MRYFDRSVQEIDYDQWWQHMHNPKYVMIDRHFFGQTDICTSWLGLQTDYDQLPVMWVTMVRKFEMNDTPQLNMVVWSSSKTSLEEVSELHINLAKEIGMPFGETQANYARRQK